MRNKLSAVAARVDRLAVAYGAHRANCGRNHIGGVKFLMPGDVDDDWPGPDVERECGCGRPIVFTKFRIAQQPGAVCRP